MKLSFAFALGCALNSCALADPSLLQLDARDELASSPPHYPAPWMNPEADGWQNAYAQAKDFVSQMTLLEKVNLTTGVG